MKFTPTQILTAMAVVRQYAPELLEAFEAALDAPTSADAARKDAEAARKDAEAARKDAEAARKDAYAPVAQANARVAIARAAEAACRAVPFDDRHAKDNGQAWRERSAAAQAELESAKRAASLALSVYRGRK